MHSPASLVRPVFAALLFLTATSAIPVSAQQDAALVATGAAVFSTNCAACHGDNGEGTRDARAIIGARSRVPGMSASRLDDFVRTQMPDDNPGSLGDDEYTAVIAFLRAQNGL